MYTLAGAEGRGPESFVAALPCLERLPAYRYTVRFTLRLARLRIGKIDY